MPAKAGIHDWIPASAGMTHFSASDGQLTHYRPLRLLCFGRLSGHIEIWR